MIRLVVVTVIYSSLVAGVEAATPTQLFGKSVVVSWTETRSSRWVGDGDRLFNTLRYGGLQVYISSAGKVFNRQSMKTPKGEGGASDQVAGGAPDKFENRVVNFRGQAMTLATPMIGGVRNVAIEFDSSFSTCNAKVLTGMAPGGKMVVMKSLPSGRPFEIHSIQSGQASCTIQNGNVFGGS